MKKEDPHEIDDVIRVRHEHREKKRHEKLRQVAHFVDSGAVIDDSDMRESYSGMVNYGSPGKSYESLQVSPSMKKHHQL